MKDADESLSDEYGIAEVRPTQRYLMHPWRSWLRRHSVDRMFVHVAIDGGSRDNRISPDCCVPVLSLAADYRRRGLSSTGFIEARMA
jgi:hypothetical protein